MVRNLTLRPMNPYHAGDTSIDFKKCSGKKPVVIAVVVAVPVGLLVSLAAVLSEYKPTVEIEPAVKTDPEVNSSAIGALLVIGGVDLVERDSLSDVEAVALEEGIIESCMIGKPPNYPDSPLGVHSAVGAVIDNKVLVCGGFGYPDLSSWRRSDTSSGYRRDCHSYSFRDRAWDSDGTGKTIRLIRERSQAASVVTGNGRWVVMGGQGGRSSETTSEILEDGAFVPGPELPLPMAGHCAVEVNSSHSFLSGGRNFAPNAYLLETAAAKGGDFTWKRLPDMSQGRSWHSCGVVDGGTEVVVTGGQTLGEYHTIGFGDRGYIRATEILSLLDGRWRTGPSLPQAIDEAASIRMGNTFLVIGGQGGESDEILSSIYGLDLGNMEWIKIGSSLSKGRKSHTVVAVENGLLMQGCKMAREAEKEIDKKWRRG